MHRLVRLLDDSAESRPVSKAAKYLKSLAARKVRRARKLTSLSRKDDDRDEGIVRTIEL